MIIAIFLIFLIPLILYFGRFKRFFALLGLFLACLFSWEVQDHKLILIYGFCLVHLYISANNLDEKRIASILGLCAASQLILATPFWGVGMLVQCVSGYCCYRIGMQNGEKIWIINYGACFLFFLLADFFSFAAFLKPVGALMLIGLGPALVGMCDFAKKISTTSLLNFFCIVIITNIFWIRETIIIDLLFFRVSLFLCAFFLLNEQHIKPFLLLLGLSHVCLFFLEKHHNLFIFTLMTSGMLSIIAFIKGYFKSAVFFKDFGFLKSHIKDIVTIFMFFLGSSAIPLIKFQTNMFDNLAKIMIFYAIFSRMHLVLSTTVVSRYSSINIPIWSVLSVIILVLSLISQAQIIT